MSRKDSRLKLKYYRYISPSQFTTFCHRQVWYAWRTDDPAVLQPRVPEAYMSLRTMDAGTGLHWMESYMYMSYIDFGTFKPFGDWECSCCGTVIRGLKPAACLREKVVYDPATKEITTSNCKDNAEWHYAECSLLDKDKYLVRGTADLILTDGINRIVVDFKTTGSKKFAKLVSGELKVAEANIIQIKLYMLISGADEGVISYINRDEPWRTFEVVVHGLDKDFMSAVNRRAGVMNGLKTLEKPPARMCAGQTGRMHNQCPFRDTCFGK